MLQAKFQQRADKKKAKEGGGQQEQGGSKEDKKENAKPPSGIVRPNAQDLNNARANLRPVKRNGDTEGKKAADNPLLASMQRRVGKIAKANGHLSEEEEEDDDDWSDDDDDGGNTKKVPKTSEQMQQTGSPFTCLRCGCAVHPSVVAGKRDAARRARGVIL